MISSWLKKGKEMFIERLALTPRLLNNPRFEATLLETISNMGMALYPAGGAIHFSADDAHVLPYMVDHLDNLPEKQANLLCTTLLVYEYIIPRIYGYRHRFSSMSPEDRELFIARLTECPFYVLRMLTLSLRMFFSFGYLADERVLNEMGFFKQHDYPADSRKIEIRGVLEPLLKGAGRIERADTLEVEPEKDQKLIPFQTLQTEV